MLYLQNDFWARLNPGLWMIGGFSITIRSAKFSLTDHHLPWPSPDSHRLPAALPTVLLGSLCLDRPLYLRLGCPGPPAPALSLPCQPRPPYRRNTVPLAPCYELRHAIWEGRGSLVLISSFSSTSSNSFLEDGHTAKVPSPPPTHTPQ